MKSTSFILAALILPALLCPSLHADVMPPAQDTSSNKSRLTLPAGKSTILTVTALRTGYVQFNLENLPGDVIADDIIHARLRLYFTKVVKPGDLKIYEAPTAWTENALSNEPGSGGGGVIASIPSNLVVKKTFVEVDVTTTVKAWKTTPASNFGFAIVGTGLANVGIGSKEGSGSGYPAELEIQIERGVSLADGSIGSLQLDSNLTLGGTTMGTFSGNLTGNVSGSAASFTGALSGDISGTQGSTVVGRVGGLTAAQVATGSGLALNASSLNLTNAIVRRDSSGGVALGTTTIDGLLNIPLTAGASSGVIFQNGSRFIHTYGSSLFTGSNAGNFTSTGLGNAGFGTNTLISNTSGSANTAIGIDVLQANTTGEKNTAVGLAALFTNTEGSDNTASGTNALSNNTVGDSNTAYGSEALLGNTQGNSNTAVGLEAMRNSQMGSENLAVGANALRNNNDGSNNIAVGYEALYGNSTGDSNIAIGSSAGSNTSGDNNIAIGNAGVFAESATIRIGTSATHTQSFIAGIQGVTTGVNDAVPVLVDSNGQLGTISSSRRYKEDITEMGDASSRIHSLRPVTFHYKKPYADGSKPMQYGLIAEEVATAFPELAVINREGKPETVKYHDLTPLLLNEVQRLHKENVALKKDINERIKRLEELLPSSSDTAIQPH